MFSAIRFHVLQIFVEQLAWVTSTVYLEILALSQCLPGPTSTQVPFYVPLNCKSYGRDAPWLQLMFAAASKWNAVMSAF